MLGILCLWSLSASVVEAESGGSNVEGVVRDLQKRPVAEARVSVDDQVEGRTQTALTDAAGHFRFDGVTASTYMLRFRKSGYLDRTEGPFAIGRGETKSLNLQMMTEKNAASARTEEQAMQYSDEPQFTVAGVTDPSDVGGHGSNVTLPTKEALAREAASLGGGTSGGRGSAAGNVIGYEWPAA